MMRAASPRSAGPFLLLMLGGCFGGPQWIHRLPGSGRPTMPLEELRGTYVRTVESRYSAANRSVGWQGREWLEIGNGQANHYVKLHLFVEQNAQRARRVAYREAGTIQMDGSWVLLRPTEAGLFRAEIAVTRDAPALPLPNPAAVRLEPISTRPLLYFFDAREGSLTPATFERFGQTFEHGIFEGCREPFETVGPAFRAATQQYNHKVFHRHGYFRVPPTPDQTPRNRNVLFPSRRTSPSWSARGRSSLRLFRYVGAPVLRS